MAKNRYFKTTKGFNGEIIVAKGVAYTTDATYALFVANAVEGEVGVYNADTFALLDANVNAAAGTKVFIAQKRNDLIHKSTPFVISSGMATRTAYQAPVKDVWTVTPPAVTAGDVWELVFIETTPVAQPFPNWNFDLKVKTGETLANAIIRFAGYINDPLAGQNYINGQAFVATYTGTTLILTATEFGRHFKVVLRQKLYDGSVAHTTPFKAGIGTYDNVAQAEAEGIIFSGTTTNYPIHGTPAEYGGPTPFATSGLGYNTYIFSPWMDEYSPTPVDRHFHKKHTVLFTPSTGTTPDIAIGTIFGFMAPV